MNSLRPCMYGLAVVCLCLLVGFTVYESPFPRTDTQVGRGNWTVPRRWITQPESVLIDKGDGQDAGIRQADSLTEEVPHVQ